MSHYLVDIRSPDASDASIDPTNSLPCAHRVKEIITWCRWRNQLWSVAVFANDGASLRCFCNVYGWLPVALLCLSVSTPHAACSKISRV